MLIGAFNGSYRWLSNFYLCDVAMDGETYPSVEHAFQAAKTADITMRRVIRQAPTPGLAKKLGKAVKRLRPDWDTARMSVMHDLLRQKFAHPELRELLLATGAAELVEGNYWNDRYWGSVEGVGENNLGRLLMMVRQELCSQVAPG